MRIHIQMKKVIQQRVITGTVIALAVMTILMFVALSGKAIRADSSKDGGSGGESFHPNAWKFAELVKDATPYRVDHVVDGDTIVADVLGHDITLRMIGMDTPETVDPRKPVECFGPEASAEAKRIFAAGSSDGTDASPEIYIEKDSAAGDYDKYGRLLAYVFPPQGATEDDGSLFPPGLSCNEYMIEKGYAREYTYMKDPYKYQAQFKADQKSAQAAGIGVWNKAVCPKPFSY